MDKWGNILLIFFLIWCIITDIIFIIIIISKFFICRNIEDCRNRKCIVNEICNKYNKYLTQEEYNYLINFIENNFNEEGT